MPNSRRIGRHDFASEQPTLNARKILHDCEVAIGANFHTLDASQVLHLLEWADTCHYRKPRNANGSRGRYFHAKLQREASRVLVIDARNIRKTVEHNYCGQCDYKGPCTTCPNCIIRTLRVKP